MTTTVIGREGASATPDEAKQPSVSKPLPFNPSKRKCTWCGKKATCQTTKGEHAEQAGHLPQNWDYYCDKCWDEGVELEHEAMYG